MKPLKKNIAIHIFLAACILFGQVGVNFFHDKHDAHEHITKETFGQTSFHKHGEHCQVCSLDLLLQIDEVRFTFVGSSIDEADPVARHYSLPQLNVNSYTKGRAPPFVI